MKECRMKKLKNYRLKKFIELYTLKNSPQRYKERRNGKRAFD